MVNAPTKGLGYQCHMHTECTNQDVTMIAVVVNIGANMKKREGNNMSYPLDINEAMDWLEKQLLKKEKEIFKSMSEEEMGVRLHHSTGRYLRNTLKLWDTNSQMYKYFQTIGISHADDMSSIILRSLYRRMNNTDIELESQVKEYQQPKKYWL
jgi:hypothetical protein